MFFWIVDLWIVIVENWWSWFINVILIFFILYYDIFLMIFLVLVDGIVDE